jgi:NitT/TauT family transport system ATP-binding protein
MAFVEVDQVSLTYADVDGRGDGTLALEGTTLSIAEGEIVAVVGPSGCGKSTLLKLISGLARPSRGAVRVDGRAVDRPLKIVGMAFQNPTLLPWRGTLANVLLPLEIVEPQKSAYRRDAAPFLARARALLDTVGLAGFDAQFPWQLSGGMQQRASLCRALIHEPRLLLLDEPFGALDAFTREELWDVLQGLWLKQRFTGLLVTHDLREAVYLADTVHVFCRRPGKAIHSERIALPRPRTLEHTFTEAFNRAVHDLRGLIQALHA